MQNDKIEIFIDGKPITRLLAWELNADIYLAAASFSFHLGNWGADIRQGSRCLIYINGSLEMTGLVDGREKTYDKERGTSLRVFGRDLMGLIVDSYVTEFVSTQGTTVKSLARTLLAKVPFLDRKSIVYEEVFAGKIKKLAKKKNAAAASTVGLYDTPHQHVRIEPRMTIFSALKSYAQSRGFMFFGLPDGTLVFGKPRSQGAAAFWIRNRHGGGGNNVLLGTELVDIARRYSTYRVLGQQQTTGQAQASGGPYTASAAQVNTGASITDPDFPYTGYMGTPIYKPFVAINNNDYQSPAMHCRLEMEKARHEGYRLEYLVPYHAQGTKNWTINQLCAVDDDDLGPGTSGIHQTYLIYGRTFSGSKEAGTTTQTHPWRTGLS